MSDKYEIFLDGGHHVVDDVVAAVEAGPSINTESRQLRLQSP